MNLLKLYEELYVHVLFLLNWKKMLKLWRIPKIAMYILLRMNDIILLYLLWIF